MRRFAALGLVGCGVGEPELASVALERVAGVHALAEVEVDGEAWRCLVDTGADALYLRWPGGQVGAPIEGVTARVGGLEVPSEVLVAADEAFLDALASAVGVSTLPCVLGTPGWPAEVLGFDWQADRVWLGETVVEVEAAIGQPRLASVPLITAEPVPVGEVGLPGGASLLALFDTGASELVLCDAAYGRLTDPPPLTPGTAVTADGELTVGFGVLERVTVGALRFEQVPVAVFDVPQLAVLRQVVGVQVEGVLGADLLTRHAWVLDRGAPAALWLGER